MPNIAVVFKDEIARVARKEMRSEISAVKKSSTTHRTEIAALKRRVQALEQMLRRLGKQEAKSSKAAPADAVETTETKHRFSAKGLASQRKRLGLSAHDCGLLIGASSQSIYNWEAGTAVPRAKHLPAIAALRGLGKKSAAAALETLSEVLAEQ